MAKLPKFNDPNLLRRALTHRSLPNHNEQLEFLGDAILQGVITARLIQRYPHYSEGLLTKERAKLVNNRALAKLARNLSLGQQLYLAKGTIQQGGRKNPKILADALEAIIGAYFIDSGQSYLLVEQFIRQLFNF